MIIACNNFHSFFKLFSSYKVTYYYCDIVHSKQKYYKVKSIPPLSLHLKHKYRPKCLYRPNFEILNFANFWKNYSDQHAFLFLKAWIFLDMPELLIQIWHSFLPISSSSWYTDTTCFCSLCYFITKIRFFNIVFKLIFYM